MTQTVWSSAAAGICPRAEQVHVDTKIIRTRGSDRIVAAATCSSMLIILRSPGVVCASAEVYKLCMAATWRNADVLERSQLQLPCLDHL